MKSGDKNQSIQPITEKILDEENEESGRIDKPDEVEEEIDDDIERSPDIIDLHAVRANDDGAERKAAEEESDGVRLNL